MAKNNFIKSLIKLAEKLPLFSHSMRDKHKSGQQFAGQTSTDAPKVKYTQPVDRSQLYVFNRDYDWKEDYGYTGEAQTGSAYKKKTKFVTAKPSSTKVTVPDVDYAIWSKKVPFEDIYEHIIANESMVKGTQHFKSVKPNHDGTFDYGFFQINDNNLSRDKSGWKVADAYDPVFDKYHKLYNTKYGGQEVNGVMYQPLAHEPTNIEHRRFLLQLPMTEFNSYGPSLSYDLAKILYEQRGIGQWSSRDKVIKAWYDNQNAVASSN